MSYALSHSTGLQDEMAEISLHFPKGVGSKSSFVSCCLELTVNYFFSNEESFHVRLTHRKPSETLFVNYISIQLGKILLTHNIINMSWGILRERSSVPISSVIIALEEGLQGQSREW